MSKVLNVRIFNLDEDEEEEARREGADLDAIGSTQTTTKKWKKSSLVVSKCPEVRKCRCR
jgi:hypothetical protein